MVDVHRLASIWWRRGFGRSRRRRGPRRDGSRSIRDGPLARRRDGRVLGARPRAGRQLAAYFFRPLVAHGLRRAFRAAAPAYRRRAGKSGPQCVLLGSRRRRIRGARANQALSAAALEHCCTASARDVRARRQLLRLPRYIWDFWGRRKVARVPCTGLSAELLLCLLVSFYASRAIEVFGL